MEAERRKQKVRETLLELLGGLPDYRGPLNAQITGQIQAEGYTIEKVLFQSLPNFYVTAISTGPISRDATPPFFFNPATRRRENPSRSEPPPTWL